MNKTFQCLGLTGCAANLLACTVMQPLSVDAKLLLSELHHGDKVQISTVSGQQLKLTVDSVDDHGLHAGGQTITYGNILEINREHVSAGRTTILILGVVAAGALAVGSGGGGGGGSSGGGGGY